MPIYLCALEFRHRLSKYPAMASLSHRQGWSFAVVLLIFPCVFFGRSNTDSPAVTYRTGASEVRITFFATDENNHLVNQIGENDFAVVDSEMVIRDFRSLRRSDETQLDIVLLVDASESVGRRFRGTTEDVLRLVSENSQGSRDKISIITFAGLKPAFLCVDDCSDPEVDRKLQSLTPAGPTPLFDSLAFAARFISNRHTGGVRQLLIVFSDGVDTISGSSPRDTLRALAATGALLYSINVESSKRETNGKPWLQQMAEVTGGRSFSMQDSSADILQGILADLRASYVVTYPLPNRAAGFHSLRILPKNNLNLEFHCRRGYFYEESH